MAETIGTYYFQLAPSAEGISEKMSAVLGDAGKDAGGSIADGLSGALTGVAGFAGAALAGVTAAVGTLTGAIVESGEALLDATVAAAEYGDNVDKMSQKMGISAEAYQEWEAVMQHSGTSMEALKASMKTMANAAQKGNEAFQALGITEEEVATLSQEDLFGRVIEGLQGMEEGTERTYIANQLLGRGATELGALLNTSAEDTQAMKDRLHELGGVMSDEDVKAAAAFQDSLQDMTTGFEALQRNLVSGFMPSLTSVMDGVSDIFAGDTDKGLENISAGVEGLIGNITDLVPKLLSVGGSLVSTLAQSILDNLPTLIQVGGEQLVALMEGLSAPGNIESIMAAVQTIIETLLSTATTVIPQLLVMGNDILRGIVQGITEALPDLIPMAAELISVIATTIAGFLPENQQIGMDLLLALGDGLMAALPAIISMIPPIIDALISVIIGNQLLFIQAGTTILESLLSSGNLNTIINSLVANIPLIIDSLIGTLIEATPLFIQAGFDLLVALVKNTPGITLELISALISIEDALLQELANLIVKFEDIGGQIMQGLADGIVNAGDAVVSTAKGVLDKIPQGAKDLFQINSPSKLFEGYGEYLDMGLALGIEQNADVPQSAMTSMARDVSTSFVPANNTTTNIENNSTSGGDIVIPVYIGQERIDEIIINATNRVNYKSGGRT
jgi:hypothetical protein